jgi:type IV secretory pathway TrbL component
MYDSVASEQDGSLSARRAVVLALVGVLLLSSVGGVIGSSGIAAAQQVGSGGNGTAGNGTAGNATTAGTGMTTSNRTTVGSASSGSVATNSSSANPVRATIQDFRNSNVSYNNLSAQEKRTCLA